MKASRKRFHSHRGSSPAEGEQRDPLADVPGETRNLQPRAVAVELSDGHPPGGEATAELGDDVLLVAALVRVIDGLLGPFLPGARR